MRYFLRRQSADYCLVNFKNFRRPMGRHFRYWFLLAIIYVETHVTFGKDKSVINVDGNRTPPCSPPCQSCSNTGQCTQCISGRFGDTCEQFCYSKGCKNNSCYMDTGSCIWGCIQGYNQYRDYAFEKGYLCQSCGEHCDNCRNDFECHTCHEGFWGLNCELSCSDLCHKKSCRKSDGLCDGGCAAGYRPETVNGQAMCTRCADSCRECHDNVSCSACQGGQWGQRCEYRCSELCTSMMCHLGDGECTHGCAIGYHVNQTAKHICQPCPENCTECLSDAECLKCKYGQWGTTCESTCPVNCTDSTCLQSNISCDTVCPEICRQACNVEIYTCSLEKSDKGLTSGNIILWALVGVAALMLTCLSSIVIVLIVRRKCKKKEEVKSNGRGNDVIRASVSQENAEPVSVDAMNGWQVAENDVIDDLTLDLPPPPCHMLEAPPLEEQYQEDVYMNDGRNQDGNEPEYYNMATVSRTRIHVEELEEKVRVFSESGSGLSEEFQKLTSGLVQPYTAAIKPENSHCNRFRSYIPYDDSRVILQGLPSDYINASYINGYITPKTYIAAQGPTRKTCEDFVPFWSMVWQEGVRQIAMLTNLVEKKDKKCDQYWPEMGSTLLCGDVSITIEKEEISKDYMIRNLRLFCPGNRDRKVTHLQYFAWSDDSVPSDVASLLEVREKLRDCRTRDPGPLLVHCSAGVGRTGTFIGIDFLIEQGISEDHVDVFACVNNLRHQRPHLVRNQMQYEFLYRALAYTFGSQGTNDTLSSDGIYANT